MCRRFVLPGLGVAGLALLISWRFDRPARVGHFINGDW